MTTDLEQSVNEALAADPAIAAWKANFTDPVMKCAKQNPTAYLEMLCANVRHFPEAIPLFSDALEEFGEFFEREAGSLGKLGDARRSQAAEAQS